MEINGSDLMEMKAKALFSKNLSSCRYSRNWFYIHYEAIYGSIAGSGGMNDQLKGMALSYGALMSISQ